MKIILMSMPDVAPVIMHESAFHMPNCGIASVGGNIDDGHEVFIIDLQEKLTPSLYDVGGIQERSEK